MSELNVYHHELRHNEYAGFYLKFEADKVIAEKDAEIVELKKQVHDYTLGLFVIQATAEKEARHHKYKRCEAMVNLCDLKECYLYARALRTYKRSEMDYFEKKSEFYHKWYKKWLELLAKFKEMAK